MDTKELGNFGEKMACEYLVKKGFKILGRNYRINFGEIDIIAHKKWKPFTRPDKTIHFVEVKTLRQSQGKPDDDFFPEERVDYKKQRKLRNLAQIWIQKNKFAQDYPYQIDIIGILVNETTRNAKLHYFGNVVEDKS